MPRICFYISSHGFGHSTREIEIIAHIPLDIGVEIITAAPEWLFRESLKRPFLYTPLHHDSGIVQADSFHQDVDGTYETWQRLLDAYPRMAEEEAIRLSGTNVCAVVGDVSPFAMAVAERLTVPSFLVANFGWDWIFTTFLAEKAEFQQVIQRIEIYYRSTGLLLRTPLCEEMRVFPRRRDIPLVVRRSRQSRSEIRAQLGLAEDDAVVLLSFGGMGMSRLTDEIPARYPDFIFLTFDPNWAGSSNVVVLDSKRFYHPDAMQACDIALAKLGYGMVSECIAHQTPIAYPPRDHFPEHEILEREIQRYVPVMPISFAAFLEGDWDFLQAFYRVALADKKKPTIPPNLPLDGGAVAAALLAGSARG